MTADITAEPAGALSPRADDRRLSGRLVRSPSGAIGTVGVLAMVTVAVLAPALAPHDPFTLVAPPLAEPSRKWPMGADALGHDLLSQVVFGARTSLTITAIVGALALAIGGTVGLIAGTARAWIDETLMRMAEVVQIVPRFFLALVVATLFGPGTIRLALLLGVTSWPTLARIVRAETTSLRERDFVTASRALGAPRRRVVTHEILPNVAPTALAYLGLVMAQALLIEAGIGFLGLGDPNAVSWGQLAGEAQRYLRIAWWLPLFPGAAIATTVLSLNLLADALGDLVARRR